MNKDSFEGGVRAATGQDERFVGSATGDKASEVKGAYNEVAGSAVSAGQREVRRQGDGRFRFHAGSGPSAR